MNKSSNTALLFLTSLLFTTAVWADTGATSQDEHILSKAAEKSLVQPRTELFLFKPYGQINRALLAADNGKERESFSVDNDSSPSRLGMTATALEHSEGIVDFGVQLEFGISSGNASAAEFNQKEGDFKISDRKIEAFIKTESYGNLWLGMGDMASNDSAEQDISGTYVIAESQVCAGAARLRFNSDTVDYEDAPALRDVFSNFDGLSRLNRIRYDSPSWSGVSISASAAADNRRDIALNYNKSCSGHKMVATAAFAEKGNDVDQVSGSCSLLLKNGLSLTLAGGGQDVKGITPSQFYAKLGYRKPFLSCGDTCMSVDYGVNREVSNSGDEAVSCSAAVNQIIKDWSTEIYLGVRLYELESDTASYDDMIVAMSGIRIKF